MAVVNLKKSNLSINSTNLPSPNHRLTLTLNKKILPLRYILSEFLPEIC